MGLWDGDGVGMGLGAGVGGSKWGWGLYGSIWADVSTNEASPIRRRIVKRRVAVAGRVAGVGRCGEVVGKDIFGVNFVWVLPRAKEGGGWIGVEMDFLKMP